MNRNPAGIFNSESNFFLKTALAIIIIITYNLSWFKNDNLFLLLSFVIISISSLGLLFIYRINSKELLFFICTLTIMLFGWVLNSVIGDNTINIGIYLNIFICILISYIIITRDHKNIIFNVFYKFYFYYLLLLLLLLLLGKDPESIFQGSRNLISQLFVIFGALFFVYEPFRSQLKHKILFYVCIVGVCILAMGRSGIITSSILLLAVLIDHYKFKLIITRKHLIRALTLITVLVASLVYMDSFINFIDNYSRFDYIRDRGTSDTSRSLMIQEYIDNFNMKVFFFGVDLERLPIIASHNNNPHNSFIYLQAKLGIFAITIFSLIALFLIKLIFKFKVSVLLAMLAILLRLATDSLDALIMLPVIFIGVYGIYYNPRLKN